MVRRCLAVCEWIMEYIEFNNDAAKQGFIKYYVKRYVESYRTDEDDGFGEIHHADDDGSYEANRLLDMQAKAKLKAKMEAAQVKRSKEAAQWLRCKAAFDRAIRHLDAFQQEEYSLSDWMEMHLDKFKEED